MRIAVLLCGQPRFRKDFNDFLTNLKGFDAADYFCYFTPDNTAETEEKMPMEFWRQILDKTISRNFLQSLLPANSTIQEFELSDSDYISLPSEPAGVTNPMYKAWYNLYQVNQLRIKFQQENNIQYDMIVRARPDVGLLDELDVSQLVGSEYLIIPKNKIASHWTPNSPRMCDQFSLGGDRAMNVYCNMIQTTGTNPYTQNREMWNAESAHGYHMITNNISVASANFRISLRGDGNN